MGTESQDAAGGPVVHPAERHVVELDSGVIWERRTSHQHEDVDFLHVIYVGGSSPQTSDSTSLRARVRLHPLGRLGVQLGFERHELGPGDSIAFDSTTPHRLWNLGDEAVHGVWFVVGRSG